MFVTSRAGLGRTISMRRRNRGGLGTIATPVGGSLVYSSNPVSQRAPLAPTNLRLPIRVSVGIQPTWGSNPPRSNFPGSNFPSYSSPGSGWGAGSTPWSAGNSPYGSTPQNPNNSQALAAAQALLATNPSLLTPSQFHDAAASRARLEYPALLFGV